MAKKTSNIKHQTSNLQPSTLCPLPSTSVSSSDAATIAAAIRQQVAVVGEIELRGNFEKLKLGAMVSEAVKRLKLEDLAANRGRNSVGGGALGWWNDVCPKNDAGEIVIAYRTVMRWKAAAENLPALMGLGVKKREGVVSLLAENPAEAVGKDAKILASAEKAANGMTMRQMLLWGGDEERRPGRPAGTKALEFKKDPPEVESARIWNDIKINLECRVVRDSIDNLEPRIAAIMVGVLTGLVKNLNRRARA